MIEDKCGKFAASFIPRWGWSFPCALPKGHSGEHRAGGNCIKHGTYVMLHGNEPPQCPLWPDCAVPDKLPNPPEDKSYGESNEDIVMKMEYLLSSHLGDFKPQLPNILNVPSGQYIYVKVDLRNDWVIKAGQSMFLKYLDTWEVTGNLDKSSIFIGVALNNIRYRLWEYILWIITRMVRFSPIRYVFIQESGFTSEETK